MAIARIQGGNTNTGGTASGTATISATFGSLPVAGRFVGVVVQGFMSGAGTFPTNGCADNQGVGNTWVRAATSNDTVDNCACAIYYCESIGTVSNPFTVTVTGTANLFGTMRIIEFSGVATSSALDQIAQAANNSTPSSPATTGACPATAQAESLLLSVLTLGSASQSDITENGSGNSGTNATEEMEYLDGTFEPGEGNSRIVTDGPAAYTSSWALGTTQNWACALAAFKAAAGGGSNLSVGIGSLGEPVVGGSTF